MESKSWLLNNEPQEDDKVVQLLSDETKTRFSDQICWSRHPFLSFQAARGYFWTCCICVFPLEGSGTILVVLAHPGGHWRSWSIKDVFYHAAHHRGRLWEGVPEQHPGQAAWSGACSTCITRLWNKGNRKMTSRNGWRGCVFPASRWGPDASLTTRNGCRQAQATLDSCAWRPFEEWWQSC